MIKIAKYISYLFIPPVMNFFLFIYLSFHFGQNSIVYPSFVFGLLLPLVIILIFRKKGIISNNDATIKEERTIPYMYAIFFSLLGVCSGYYLKHDPFIIMMWMVYLYNSIFILNINRFWKISAHAVGAAMPVGALCIIGTDLAFGISVFVLTIVSFARIILKVHKISQVVSGGIMGFSVSYIFLRFLLYFQ